MDNDLLNSTVPYCCDITKGSRSQVIPVMRKMVTKASAKRNYKGLYKRLPNTGKRPTSRIASVSCSSGSFLPFTISITGQPS